MNKVKSIWDGWKTQLFGQWSDYKGGYCALGYIDGASGYSETINRVADYIRRNYDLPDNGSWADGYRNRLDLRPNGSASSVIIYANNILKFSPEDFRRIDILTQTAPTRMK